MPLPEQYLSEHPLLLGGIGVLLFAFNTLLYLIADRRRSRIANIQSVPPLSLRSRLLRPLIGVTVFLLLTWYFDAGFRAFFGGAFLVMQLAGLSHTIGTLLTTRSLLRPGATEGSIVYPTFTQARIMAASLISVSVVCLGASALTASPGLLGGGIFLATTALGYYRRGGQYARAAARSAAQA